MILLVLGSLNNVVGYQSVKSTIVNDSPLFQSRSQKATHQQHNIIISDYLGKGKETNLYLPKRESEKEYIDRVINIFKEMGDKSFDEFVNKFISYIHQNNFNNLKASDKEIKDILYQMKSNPETLKNYYLMIKEKGRLESTFDNICLFAILLTIFLWPIFVLVFLYFAVKNIKESFCIFFDLPNFTSRGA